MSQISLPNAKDKVFTKSGKGIVLTEHISDGGEGKIFLTDQPNLVAKIYHVEKLTKDRYDKLNLMISKRIFIRGVCWPTDLLYNTENEFIGFLMPEAEGYEMAVTVFKPGKSGLRHMSDWNRVDLVNLTLTICHIFAQLHSKDILVGDVNARNILINSSLEVYFVDADSFQVGKYPCPVGTEIFTAPEIFEKNKVSGEPLNYGSFLRTKRNEQYALASLIFQLLMPGKSPFVQQGDNDIANSIIQHKFGFPFGDYKGEDAPGGKWRFIWSHIPYALKEHFYSVFALDRRYSAEEWISVLEAYKNDLERGYVNNEIFPNTFKEYGSEFLDLVCEECGVKFNMDKDTYLKRTSDGKPQRILCKVCADAIRHNNNIIVSMKCEKCGKNFSIARQRATTLWESGRLLLCPSCDSEARGPRRNNSSNKEESKIIASDLPKHNPWSFSAEGVVAIGMEEEVFQSSKTSNFNGSASFNGNSAHNSKTKGYLQFALLASCLIFLTPIGILVIGLLVLDDVFNHSRILRKLMPDLYDLLIKSKRKAPQKRQAEPINPQSKKLYEYSHQFTTSDGRTYERFTQDLRNSSKHK